LNEVCRDRNRINLVLGWSDHSVEKLVMKTASTILAAAVVAAGATSLSVPASAAPITLPSSLQSAMTLPLENVQWRRWGVRGWGWGPGLVAGAVISGAIAASRPWYYDDYAYSYGASPYGAYAYSSPYGTGPSGYNSYNYNYAPGYSSGSSYAYVPDYNYSYSPGYSYAAGDSVAYCKQRFRSYDPASGTYLGYDGRRHPCP
jgi:BA14K-like protein